MGTQAKADSSKDWRFFVIYIKMTSYTPRRATQNKRDDRSIIETLDGAGFLSINKLKLMGTLKEATIKKIISEHYRERAIKSHEAVKAKYGNDYYKNIVNIRWAKYRADKDKTRNQKPMNEWTKQDYTDEAWKIYNQKETLDEAIKIGQDRKNDNQLDGAGKITENLSQ